MSDKITFDALIDSVSEKTERSKTFTHDFVKDLVSEIQRGLMEDEKVNIAQFGKFELHNIDEKEGYNPQEDQKMTIPAHRKAVFKPYKKVRARVNAAYAGEQPQLLGKKNEEKEQQTSFNHTASPGQDTSATGKNRSPQSKNDSPHAPRQPILGPLKEFSGLISAGVALAAATAGAWIFFKRDK